MSLTIHVGWCMIGDPEIHQRLPAPLNSCLAATDASTYD